MVPPRDRFQLSNGSCIIVAVADPFRPARLKRLAVRFSRPVYPGSTITTKVWSEGNRNGRLVYTYEDV